MRFSRIRLLLLALFCFASALTGYAETGSDFSGSFQITNAVLSDSTVQVTARLRVFNHAGDIAQATIAIRNSVSPESVLVSFPDVAIAADDSIIVSGTFTVSTTEYEDWLTNNRSPFVTVDYQDENGQALRQRVAMLNEPVGGGN